MEYNNYEKLLDFFKKEINQIGSEKIKELENEISEIKDREIGKIRSDIEENVNRYKMFELKSVNTDHSSEINKINNKNHRLLMQKRQELIDSIFNDVIKKINKYIKTDNYYQLMEKKLLKALKILKADDIVFKYKKDDKLLKKILSENGFKDKTTIASTDILIGGFIASSVKRRIEINETLDVRLEEKKQWFFENSNLFIRN